MQRARALKLSVILSTVVPITNVRPLAIFAISVALLAAVASLAVLRQPGLPSEIQEQLDARFPGWRLARLNDFNRRQLHASQHAAYLEGDFDGDGRTDWVIQITHPGESFRHQSVVVFLAGAEGGPPHVVQTTSENEGTYVGRRPPGVDRDVIEDTVVFSRSDFPDILFGQEAGIALVYRNGTFISYTTGD